MTQENYWERPTQRDPSGRLATRGVAKFQWAQIAQHGRVHHVDGVIVRWNFLGGTFQRPDMTFVLACGPQRHEALPVVDPRADERSASAATTFYDAGRYSVANGEVRKPEGFDTHALVACVDGPRAGAWYFEDYGSGSWARQVECASPGPGTTILGYIDSGKTVKHPRWPDVRGKALTWAPEKGEA